MQKMEAFTTTEAHSYCFILCASYVLSLYLIPKSIRQLPRDAPEHLTARILASSIVTVIAFVASGLFNRKVAGNSYLESLGIRFDNLFESCIITILLMCIFYAGPLLVNVCVIIKEMSNEYNQRTAEWTVRNHSQSLLTSLFAGLRRNLIYAPISEEIVFRSLMCRALLSALVMQQYWMGYTSHTVCYYAIGWFSIAHVHHFYEKITHMKMSISSAVANTIIQMSYTSIFGVISSYLLLRTGNVASPIVSHIICNTMGLPDVSFMNSKYSILSFLYSYKYLLLFIHAMGLVLFGMCLFPMTESMAEKSALWIVT